MPSSTSFKIFLNKANFQFRTPNEQFLNDWTGKQVKRVVEKIIEDEKQKAKDWLKFSPT